MSSADLASAGSQAEPVLHFGHWSAVRRCALALYAVGFLVWSYHYGIPVQRELVIASLLVCPDKTQHGSHGPRAD